MTVPIYPAGHLPTEAPQIPTLTSYAPAEGVSPNGPAFVVCPGGGYSHLAEHEGEPIAQWLTSLGISAHVLRYRVHESNRHPDMLHDAVRALRIVRAGGASKVGILGFSAGGHLSAMTATHFDAGDPDASDPIERMSSRPDAAVLIYPVITMRGVKTHVGSRYRLLGESPEEEMLALLSPDEQVTADTPPLFLLHTADDRVPVENSLLMAQSAAKAGVPFELHVFPQGGHGYGLAASDPVLSVWPSLCATWLRGQGFGS